MSRSILIISILVCAFTLAYWAMISFPLHTSSGGTHEILITPGMSGKDIANTLQEEGLIRSSFLFRMHILASGNFRNLQAGEFLLSPSQSIRDIANILVQGKVLQRPFTVPEGWNIHDVANLFNQKGLATTEDVYTLTGYPGANYQAHPDLAPLHDFSEKFPFLKEKPSSVSLEGYLFPETYFFASHDTAKQLIEKMLSTFEQRVVKGMKEDLQNNEMSLFEILTLASLIEKEVQHNEDKQIVSGIIHKRLETGMPLQIDATISYITGKRSTQVSLNDTHIESPYNTYRNVGLPLGPITNPGEESIEAALHPTETSYWFYLSTPEGETIFSNTHDEHVKAKALYLR